MPIHFKWVYDSLNDSYNYLPLLTITHSVRLRRTQRPQTTVRCDVCYGCVHIDNIRWTSDEEPPLMSVLYHPHLYLNCIECRYVYPVGQLGVKMSVCLFADLTLVMNGIKLCISYDWFTYLMVELRCRVRRSLRFLDFNWISFKKS